MADNKAESNSSYAEGTFNPEEEDSVTLVDVLEENEKAEEDANAVLGASDDQNCTYALGYMKRQALYACLTCKPKSDNSQLAGVCLACSYHCHDGHELVELYTKRNFRCDCGNSKFSNNPCSLNSVKEPLNAKNQYNHNFRGIYCICNKPYPDPEDSEPDDMIQCIICEDWFHSKHLGQKSPDSNYAEMSCDLCMTKHFFLQAYMGGLLDVSETNACKLEGRTQNKEEVKAVFWPEGWRKELCQCSNCLEMYKTEQLEFLIDAQDTVEFYEEKGKAARNPSQNDRLMMALSSLDRVQQIEAIQEYQSMSSNLKEYLKKFAENKKVVREEDIREFFGQLKERKRQRTSIQHFCH